MLKFFNVETQIRVFLLFVFNLCHTSIIDFSPPRKQNQISKQEEAKKGPDFPTGSDSPEEAQHLDRSACRRFLRITLISARLRVNKRHHLCDVC